jgi:NSS family neurotransmitter:Na+ symporter
MAQQPRESWGSNIGFILAAVGSCIGIGNIWRFPYVAGENGGAAFILIYLAFIIILGIPVLYSEFLLGSTTNANPVEAFRKVSANRRWSGIGFLCVLTAFFILSFYSAISGLVLGYAVEFLRATFSQLSAAEISKFFDQYTGNSCLCIFYHFLFMFLGVIIVVRGIKSGIERWSKILLPLLLLLVLISIIRSVTLPGSGPGIGFLINPNLSAVTIQTFSTAMSQAFFSLGIGMGIMITYGSYLSKREKLLAYALQISLFDTLGALLAGFAIFPALFAFGISPSSGPSLIFRTLPSLFTQMPFGMGFGFLFFIFILIAALTSAISLLEVLTTYLGEQKKWTRTKAVVVSAGAAFVLGIPSVLTFGTVKIGLLQRFNFFNYIDLLSTGYMMPLCAVLTSIFVGLYWYRLQQGQRNPLMQFLRYCILLVAPFFISQFILFPFLHTFPALDSWINALEKVIVRVNIGLTTILLLLTVYAVIFKSKSKQAGNATSPS